MIVQIISVAKNLKRDGIQEPEGSLVGLVVCNSQKITQQSARRF